MNKSFFLIVWLMLSSNFLFSQKKIAIDKISATPCMNVLDLFTASRVPAMAPEEQFAPLITSNDEPPANLPGNGLGQHSMLYVGEMNNRMSLITMAR
jgi:hypothetical protein